MQSMSKQSSRRDVPHQIHLPESAIPRQWYNVAPDLPTPVPPMLSPGTLQPVNPRDLERIFPQAIIEQELSQERWIDIPDAVREKYKLCRPAPMYRAYALEEALGTPARIYYKYEGNNTSGSHKLNSAIAQAYYNKEAGIRRLATETGAGQWGTALSMACGFFDLQCTVYMVRISARQKPFRRAVMETYGAEVIQSPSMLTQAGRDILAVDPECVGSLGIAISEAVEDAAGRDDTNYALGSVMNHVALHQTLIGLETRAQLAAIDEHADIVIACCGGGSNLAGIAFPFVPDKLQGHDVRLVAVEPTACPTLTKGKFAYDFGDVAQQTPASMQYTLGHRFIPMGIHAGGLRYHGANSALSMLVKDGLIEAVALPQSRVFDAAVRFARAEGILPAPESSHAICQAMIEAEKCRETGEEKVIVFCLSGHGYYDLVAYERYLRGDIADVEYTQEMLDQGLAFLPHVE